MEAISAGSAPFGSEMGGARRTRTEEDYFNSDDEEEEAVKKSIIIQRNFCIPKCVFVSFVRAQAGRGGAAEGAAATAAGRRRRSPKMIQVKIFISYKKWEIKEIFLSDSEEDPLDAFMANLEKDAKKKGLETKKGGAKTEEMAAASESKKKQVL